MRMIVVTFVRVWLSSSWCDEWLNRLNTTFWFSLLWYDIYFYLDDSNEKSMYDQKQEIKSIFVGMLENWTQKHSSHNNNIKYV